MIFSSKQVGRIIDVSYTTAQKGRQSSIVALIETDDGKRFSLNDWLSVHGKSDMIPFSANETPNLSEEAFIKQFCEAFEQIASHELKDILTGKTWEDVPMDWQGYR